MKHSSIFKNYNSSLQLIYDNSNEEDIGWIISLSSNFNEYIKFYCSNLKKISKKSLHKYIDFEKCPIPDENYDLKFLTQFIESIIDYEDTYFPSNQFRINQ